MSDAVESLGEVRALYEEWTVAALLRLRADGALRNADGEALWVWLYYADAFDEGVDDRTFAQLNDAGAVGLFRRRFETVDEPSLTTVLLTRARIARVERACGDAGSSGSCARRGVCGLRSPVAELPEKYALS